MQMSLTESAELGFFFEVFNALEKSSFTVKMRPGSQNKEFAKIKISIWVYSKPGKSAGDESLYWEFYIL